MERTSFWKYIHKIPMKYASIHVMYDDILFVLHSIECNRIFSSSLPLTSNLNDYIFLFCEAPNHFGGFLSINL